MYNSFYGFSTRPFRLNPDPRFFFPSSVHGRALEYLRYGMEQGEGFVVITGEPGSGKTQLMRTLIDESQSPQLETFEIVTSLLDGDDILQLLLASLNIPTQGVQKDEQLVLLRNYLFSRSRQGVRVLALIDEAHGLTPSAFEDLRQLSMNFKFGGKAPLQCFLFGHTTLLHRLGMPDMVQFQQRVIANYHLPPLTAIETIKYVEFRLTQAGWKGGPHFTAGAFALLHQHTDGVPRRINSFCDRLLQFAALRELRSIDENTGLAALQELQQERPQRVALAINNAPATLDSPRLLPDPHVAAQPAHPADPVNMRTMRTMRIKPTQHPEPHPVAPYSQSSQSSQSSPAKKTASITDENSIDDEDGVPLLMDQVQSSRRVDKMPFGRRVDRADRADKVQSRPLSAPLLADKALARLRHIWQAPHRRSPTWIALATTFAVTATLGMLGLTTTSDEHALPAQLQAETSTTSSLLAKIERSPELTLPPSADLGDEVMASIAPLVSGPSDSPATEAAPRRSMNQQQALPKPDRTASFAPSTPIRTVTAVQRVAPFRLEPAPEPTRRKPTVKSSTETNLVNRFASPPLLLAKTPDFAKPASTSNTATHFAAQTSEDVTTVQVDDPLKRAKLAALLKQFESAYQAGNMPQLTRLFAADARTDDEQGRAEIAQVYRRLFDVTDRRKIGIDNVEWDIRADQAQGVGNFVVTVVEKGARESRSYTGTLSIVIKPDQEGLVISQLHHKYASP